MTDQKTTDALMTLCQQQKARIAELEDALETVTWDYNEAMRQYDLQQKRACEAEKEIGRLTTFLLNNYPRQIGEGNPVHGESAVDVAIRLLALQPCGHPVTAVAYDDEGTHYCSMCEAAHA